MARLRSSSARIGTALAVGLAVTFTAAVVWAPTAGAAQPRYATCSTPGGTNYMADCGTADAPVNTPVIATNGTMFVAAANDWNGYNGRAQPGFYWSTDGKTWNDGGPLDLYPHGNYVAEKPSIAIDGAGVVYYANILGAFFDPTFGGVELNRRNPSDGSWTTYQLAADTKKKFQDQPAVAVSGRHLYYAWVSGSIRVADLKLGAASVPPRKVLHLPGSTNAQAPSLAADGQGGFWITWEEGAGGVLEPEIRLAHWLNGHWSSMQTISPAGFADLPNPLPGFNFGTNSYPSIALVDGSPYVVWASDDTGVGRVHLYANGSVSTVSDTGGDQFFPSIGSSDGGYAISWSQAGADSTYDQYLSFDGTVLKISTASSEPNQECHFDPPGANVGRGDTIMNGGTPMAVWTDIRRDSKACTGKAEDAMVYAP